MESEYHIVEAYIGYIDDDPGFHRKIEWWGYIERFGQISFKRHHRLDGPALIIYKNGEEAYRGYLQNDRLHRVDGPAVICTDGTALGYRDNNSFTQYHLLGYAISEKDFNAPGFIDSFILEHS